VKLIPVFVPRDGSDNMWDLLRRIRNSCSEGLTHDQRILTPLEQARYRETYSENVRHYLYLTSEDWVVAFSRLEWRDGFVYPTYGVASWARGLGFAWDVVKHAMLAAGGPLRGDLIFNNEAIKKVDFALGWRPQGPPPDANGILLVEAAWPPEFVKELV